MSYLDVQASKKVISNHRTSQPHVEDPDYIGFNPDYMGFKGPAWQIYTFSSWNAHPSMDLFFRAAPVAWVRVSDLVQYLRE